MKRSAANKLVLGMFVSIAIGLFIGAIYYMGKQRKMFGESIIVKAQFKHVGGLMVGNNVRFAGINVGTVEDIQIVNDSTVEVSLLLEQGVQKYVRKDSKAIIGAEGLMGNKLVNILPGTTAGETIEENDMLLSAKAVDFDDILHNLEKTSQNAVVISSELADLTQKINTSNGTLSRFLYDSTFAMIIENSLRNVERGTHGFEQNMEAMKNNFLFKGYFKKKERERLEAERAEQAAKDVKAGKVQKTPPEREDLKKDEKDTAPKKKRFGIF